MQNKYDFSVVHTEFVVNRKCSSDWTYNDSGNHNQHQLLINIEGVGYYSVNGKISQINSGDVAIFPPLTKRISYTDRDNPWHFISIACNLKNLYGEEYIFTKEPIFLSNVSRQIVQCFKNCSKVWNERPVAFETLCRAYIQEIFCYAAQQDEKLSYNPIHYEKIEQIKEYINDNYQKNMSVEELAAIVGLSPSHFRKTFREIVGTSATQYAIQLRINRAKDLLVSGTANVSEAAFQSGFKDIFYFSAMFKKITGENPSKYLK